MATYVSLRIARGVKRELREIWTDLAQSKGLIYELTLRDLRVRYKQAVLGVAWAVLSPLLIVAAGVFIRVGMLQVAGAGIDRALLFGIVVKGLAWGFVASAIGFTTNALSGNWYLITKVYFPREVLPLSVLLASAVDTLVGFAAAGIILPFLGWMPALTVVWAPVLGAVLFLLMLGLGLIVSCANLFFRDVKYLTQLLVTFGIFFTPVFFEPAALGARFIPLQMLNPLAPVFEGLRLSVVDGHDLLQPLIRASDGAVIWSPLYLGYSVAVAVVGLVVSALIFHRAQYRFAEIA